MTMPVPPPLPDPGHLETRLLIVLEMLESTVAEVRRAVADIQSESTSDFVLPGDDPPAEPDEQ